MIDAKAALGEVFEVGLLSPAPIQLPPPPLLQSLSESTATPEDVNTTTTTAASSCRGSNNSNNNNNMNKIKTVDTFAINNTSSNGGG